MKTLLFAFLLLLISCSAKNSKMQANEQCYKNMITDSITEGFDRNENSTSVFLNLDFSGDVKVFDKMNRVIKVVKNDIENENYVMFELLQKNDSMFYVIAYWSLDNEMITKGWIYKNNHLGIYSATYNSDFILYEKPYNLKSVIVTDEYNSRIYEVIDFDGRWLKIRTEIKNKIYSGWIPPEMQCSNVYSTCN